MAIEHPLQRPAEDATADRAGEPGVERGDDGKPQAPRRPRRHEAERGIQPAVDMDDIEALGAKQLFQTFGEPPSDGDSRDAAICVDDDACPDAAHVRMLDRLLAPGSGLLHVRSHDDRMMPQRLQFPCEIVHVLRHAAELRIVVLRDERDAQRRHRARSASRSTADTTAAGRSSWR